MCTSDSLAQISRGLSRDQGVPAAPLTCHADLAKCVSQTQSQDRGPRMRGVDAPDADATVVGSAASHHSSSAMIALCFAQMLRSLYSSQLWMVKATGPGNNSLLCDHEISAHISVFVRTQLHRLMMIQKTEMSKRMLSPALRVVKEAREARCYVCNRLMERVKACCECRMVVCMWHSRECERCGNLCCVPHWPYAAHHCFQRFHTDTCNLSSKKPMKKMAASRF
jgi:hypothetical protein